MSADLETLNKVASSPLLWTLGTLGAQKHFHLKHEDIKHAQRLAMMVHPEIVDKALSQVEADRLQKCVVRNEVKYPFLHRKFLEGESAVSLAAHYKNKRKGADKGKPITRALVYQCIQRFNKWCASRFADNQQKALKEVEALAAH